MDKEMQQGLEQDGEKLRQLTGEDHGPYFGAENISSPILFFLERIAGDGYGGRADFEIALAEARKLFG